MSTLCTGVQAQPAAWSRPARSACCSLQLPAACSSRATHQPRHSASQGDTPGRPAAPHPPPPAACRPLPARWRLHAAAGQASVQRERQGDWIIAVSRGYVEQAVAISRLLAETFVSAEYEEDEEGLPASPASVLQYQLKLLAALQWRASTLGSQFVTITACDVETGQLAGVANVAPGLTLAEAEGHLLLGPGEAAATLSNMAVAPQYRRRGLGRLLLGTAEQAALALSPPSTLMALAVYRYNDVPVQLYTSSGYLADDAWVDLRWADAAERGRVGVSRRQLMLKPLPGAPRPLAQVPRRPAATAEDGAASK